MSTGDYNLIREIWARLIRVDALTFLVLTTTIVGAWCFLELADSVAEGETRQVDEWVVHSLRKPGDAANPRGPRWLAEAVRDVSTLGGITILVLVTGAVAGYFWICHDHRSMLVVLAASLGGLFLSAVLKAVFGRPRPDLVPYVTHVVSSSFPSGHTMNSATVYLTLGLILADLSSSWRLRAYFMSCAVLLTVLVGMSRVYLGAHYPTDILGGWTAGAAWAGLCLRGACAEAGSKSVVDTTEVFYAGG
jgi:undecaprenyl-diphosphatase